MAKFCRECGEKLPDKAKFCAACGTKIDVISGEQSVHIGRDVGRDVVTAGRDVIIGSPQAELVDCKYCEGSGKVTIKEARKCWKCKGTGDRLSLLSGYSISTSSKAGCPVCGGQGVYHQRPTYVPPGTDHVPYRKGTGVIFIDQVVLCDECKGMGKIRV